MKEPRRDPASRRASQRPKPSRSSPVKWWPYAIAGGVAVLIAAFVAVTQFGHSGSGDAVNGGAGLAIGSPVPSDSVPSSAGSTESLVDFKGSKVVVYFFEGGG